MKKSKITILIASIQLILTFLLFAGSVYAWFAITLKPQTGSVDFGVYNDDSSFEIVSINGNKQYLYATRSILAGDEFILEIRAMKNAAELLLRFDARKQTEAMFESMTSREDLLRGPYEKISLLNDGAIQKYFEFDIEKHSEYNDIGQKVDFLKRFTDNNNIVSAFTAEITRVIRHEQAEIPLVVPITFLRDNESDFILYADSSEIESNYITNRLILNENDVVFLKVTYGKRISDNTTWLPTMTIESGYDLPEYRALNFNCFIGQTVLINLENSNGD